MANLVYCLIETRDQAEDIVEELKDAGFANDQISVLLPETQGTREFAHEKHTKAPEGATTGGATGAVSGGVLGWLAGIGALTIPGVGPLIAAGPIVSALAGVGAGAAVGGLAGALIGMGIPEYEAKRYETKIKAGNILVSVHSDDREQRETAKDIFEGAGAEDVSTTEEAKPPKGKERHRERRL
jgi:uncharacterized membrane protein